MTAEAFVRRARSATLLAVAAVAALTALVTILIGLYGSYRVSHAPVRSDEGGVECGDGVQMTERRLLVCP